MHEPVARSIFHQVERELSRNPAVTLLGPRQCGKTTLARQLTSARPSVFLDLERPSDLARLTDPEAFLDRHRDALVCIDEVQRMPELFPVLRALIDADRRPARFLLLGSASPTLRRSASESLAGRVAHLEMTPFQWGEVVPRHADLHRLWLRGGFPLSLLAPDDETSFAWRTQFISTFLERDIPQLGFRVPAATLGRFWRMCAHLQGALLNLSALGRSAGESHTAARHHLDILEETMVLRALPPFEANLGKRLVKSPKIYLRDSGLVHALLDLPNLDALAGHPVYGASWEGLVVEQLLAATPGWRGAFYRTASGDELDLVMERGARRVGVECKASRAPTVSKGFWNARRDLQLTDAWVVAPVDAGWPLGDGAHVMSLGEALHALRDMTTPVGGAA